MDPSDIPSNIKISLVLCDVSIEAERAECAHSDGESFYSWEGTAKDSLSGKEHKFTGLRDEIWAAIVYLAIYGGQLGDTSNPFINGMYSLVEMEMESGRWPAECRPFS